MLFTQLKERNLSSVKLIVSDAQSGLVKASRESFLGVSWQRYKIHFLRNILALVGHQDKDVFVSDLASSRQESSHAASILQQAGNLIVTYGKKYPKAIETLEDGLENRLNYYHFQACIREDQLNEHARETE